MQCSKTVVRPWEKEIPAEQDEQLRAVRLQSGHSQSTKARYCTHTPGAMCASHTLQSVKQPGGFAQSKICETGKH